MTKIRSFQMIMIHCTSLKSGYKVIYKINLEVQSATNFISATALDFRALKQDWTNFFINLMRGWQKYAKKKSQWLFETKNG